MAQRRARLAAEWHRDGDGLWQSESIFGPEDAEDGIPPRGMAPSTYQMLKQWNLARGWCSTTTLPKELYEPDVYRGLGESQLDADGCRILQRYSEPLVPDADPLELPAEPKPSTRTAQLDLPGRSATGSLLSLAN